MWFVSAAMKLAFNNAAKVPMRHAVRHSNRIHPLGFKTSHQKTDDDVFRSVEEGGWMIPCENEDAEVSRCYQAALAAHSMIV